MADKQSLLEIQSDVWKYSQEMYFRRRNLFLIFFF